MQDVNLLIAPLNMVPICFLTVMGEDVLALHWRPKFTLELASLLIIILQNYIASSSV